jgi:hypothetical protein
MDELWKIFGILIPAALVLYGMYLMVRTMIERELRSKRIELWAKQSEQSLPIRLQAYERMTLYLERISPENLIPRLNQPGLSAAQFARLLRQEVQSELSHNFAQQLYISSELWDTIKTATSEVFNLINQTEAECAEGESSTDFGKRMLQKAIEQEASAPAATLIMLKNEVKNSFWP